MKMPFGAHKGKEMDDVPADYFDWLMGQPWIDKWSAVVDYIERNRQSINKDLGVRE